MIKKYILSSLKNMKGFTLFELLLVIVIASAAGIMLVGILSQNTQLFSNQSVKISQGIELNNTQPIIEEMVKSSAGVVAQYPISGQPTYTSGLETLVLSLPAITEQGSVIANTYDYVVFHKDNQTPKIFRKRLFPDPASSRNTENQVLLTKLSTINFSYYNAANQSVSPVQATKIRYIMNVTDLVATEEKVSSVSGQVNLRND